MAAALPRPRVTLAQGTVVGVCERAESWPQTVESFKGIPYAVPPVGDRRFRPAEPVGPSTEEIDASKWGPRAPAKQFLLIGPKLEQSEDCLSVNVFRPQGADAKDAKGLPVMVYIHGGAFNRGYAAMHDTAGMVAWSASPFIGVSFGYRVGALGFLPSAVTQKEGLLNLGLRDQILLLEWVQANIGLFGGDKDKVTLMGLSAGAHSIGHHLLNYEPGTKPLFRAAIMESGAPTSRAVRHPDAPIHEQQFAGFLEELQCPAGLDGPATFAFLRSVPSDVITAAQTKIFAHYDKTLRWAFQPVIDGATIRRRPLDAWDKGLWHKVPILAGFQENEGSLYVDQQMATQDAFLGFWRTLLPQLTEADVAEHINGLYPDPLTGGPGSPYYESPADCAANKVGAQYRRLEAAYAHYAYIEPVRQTAHFADGTVPVYIYHWALKRGPVVGAAHGDNFLYGMRDPATCAKSAALNVISGYYHGYLTSFICSGSDPNAVPGTGAFADRPLWTVHKPAAADQPGQILVVGRNNKELLGGAAGEPKVAMEDDTWALAERDFWWSKVDVSQM